MERAWRPVRSSFAGPRPALGIGDGAAPPNRVADVEGGEGRRRVRFSLVFESMSLFVPRAVKARLSFTQDLGGLMTDAALASKDAVPFRPGDLVVVEAPELPRFHGKQGKVVEDLGKTKNGPRVEVQLDGVSSHVCFPPGFLLRSDDVEGEAEPLLMQEAPAELTVSAALASGSPARSVRRFSLVPDAVQVAPRTSVEIPAGQAFEGDPAAGRATKTRLSFTQDLGGTTADAALASKDGVPFRPNDLVVVEAPELPRFHGKPGKVVQDLGETKNGPRVEVQLDGVEPHVCLPPGFLLRSEDVEGFAEPVLMQEAPAVLASMTAVPAGVSDAPARSVRRSSIVPDGLRVASRGSMELSVGRAFAGGYPAQPPPAGSTDPGANGQHKGPRVKEVAGHTYPGMGAEVNWAEHADLMEEVRRLYTPHTAAIDAWIHDDAAFEEDVGKVYRKVDRDRSGLLEWKNGEIREFVVKLFDRKGWPPVPPSFDMYELYQKFDENGDFSLSRAECLNFAHALVACLLSVLL